MAFKIASFWRPARPRNFQFQSCLDTSLLAIISSLDEYEQMYTDYGLEGRHILRQMQDIASNLGFTVVAGDTDSLFLDRGNNNDRAIERFIAECKKRTGVDVEHPRLLSRQQSSSKKSLSTLQDSV